MEKIFGRAWNMVAHTSLVPNLNDFFLSYIGQDPVIVTRDADDKSTSCSTCAGTAATV